ncbi:MAG: DUF401 family protein [Deltaproteobacteria bacterium]|nr:DUF401 family protein [Deltaproteobacteria bacterium]
MPALLKIFAIFGLILFLNRLRLHLGLSLFIGAVALGLWMGLGMVDIGGAILTGITSIQTISLVCVVGLIMVMSKIMEESGQMLRLVKSFSRLSNDDRTVGVVMSALIGLLPMPGGAVFSAPMVDASLSDKTISGEQKTALNYWFRHIWEYWWPLYPGVILAVAILRVETWRYMAMAAPLTIIAVIAGTIFILRPMGNQKEDKPPQKASWQSIKQFILEMMPILIVIFTIICTAALSAFLRLLGHPLVIPSLLYIVFGLLAAMAWVGIINHISLSRFWKAAKRKDILILLLLILAIMVFREMMEDSHAVELIRNELVTYGIPIILIIVVMPFISGLITGIAMGFVGASFPLIVPMFQTPDMWNYLSYAVLAYTFGYMGMMLSPIHVCFLVTKDYFKASLFGSYPYIIKSALIVMTFSVTVLSLIIIF